MINRIITTRPFLLSASCCMGFFAWHIITESHHITSTLQLPLYFDNLTQEDTITAPESIEITVQATRKNIQKSRAEGSVHIDFKRLTPGKQLLFIHQENLLLPTAVKVINYTPVEINRI